MKDKFNVVTADPARICAQIVSGMGFLGSATIFKSNNYVKGINTAANLWISAAISMAIGADLWELGLVTSIFTIIILIINNRYKKYRYSKYKIDDDYDVNDDNDVELGETRKFDPRMLHTVMKIKKLTKKIENFCHIILKVLCPVRL